MQSSPLSSASAPGPTHRDLLHSHGLRVTAPRLAVLEAVRSSPHSEAHRIAEIVRGGGTYVSTQAVYDVLHACTRAGILRSIEPAGSPARYELRIGDNHHHLVCRSCGRVTDVECVRGAAPCLHPSDHAGFAVDEAEITFWGLCADCQADPAPSFHPAHADQREQDIS